MPLKAADGKDDARYYFNGQITHTRGSDVTGTYDLKIAYQTWVSQHKPTAWPDLHPPGRQRPERRPRQHDYRLELLLPADPESDAGAISGAGMGELAPHRIHA